MSSPESPNPSASADIVGQFAAAVKPEVADEQIDLLGCAFLIARTEYPGLDARAYEKKLAELAVRVAARLRRTCLGNQSGAPDHTETIAALNHVLFEEEKFQGNREDYYDARNSFVNDVLDRKLGIPITLALVYMETARRIGFPLSGVGMPGHFLLKHYDAHGEGILIDAFERGAILTQADCQRRLDEIYAGNISLQPQFLLSVTRRQWLNRMLNNLKTAYIAQRNFKKALPFAEMIVAIYPRSAEDVKQRAVLRYHNQQTRGAIADFNDYLEIAPEASDAAEIRQTVLSIRRSLASMN